MKIDDTLLQVFDEISLYTKHFYYGRYDIKTTSIADMKAGKNISYLNIMVWALNRIISTISVLVICRQ
jgi:hypothetical protein